MPGTLRCASPPQHLLLRKRGADEDVESAEYRGDR